MPTAKDGSKHHSMGRARLHDSMADDKKLELEKKPVAQGRAAESASVADKGMNQESPESIQDTVAMHGPADKVETMKDGEGYKTISTHGTHKHVKRHASAQEATAHVSHAFGENPTGDKALSGMMGDIPPAEGGGIPGMTS
jgi:hypothetical protein